MTIDYPDHDKIMMTAKYDPKTPAIMPLQASGANITTWHEQVIEHLSFYSLTFLLMASYNVALDEAKVKNSSPTDERTDEAIWNAACIQANKIVEQQNEQDQPVKQENFGFAFGSPKKTSSWAPKVTSTQDTRTEEIAQDIFSNEIRRRDIKKDQPRLGRSAHKVL